MALNSIDGSDGSSGHQAVDGDADAGFFEMSSASAEQVTLQIRSMMERACVAIAYQGRTHIALGYQSWNECVDDRLSDLRLTVPREQRGAVVQSMSRARMSLRAIARVLGVDPATVHRALGANDHAGVDSAEEPAPIRGRDGKSYPRRRRPAVTTCSNCGEVHEAGTVECPWDLFAQGRGTRPMCQDDPLGELSGHHEYTNATEDDERQDLPDDVHFDAHPEPRMRSGFRLRRSSTP